MAQVFISYAREDAAVASRLYQDLRRYGARPWLDTEDLKAGVPWEPSIRSAIAASSHFLALISRSSVEKRGFVQAEVKLALRVLQEIPPSEIYIIPVRLDSTKPLDRELAGLQWIDLFQSYDRGLVKILGSLGLTSLESDSESPVAERILTRLHRIFTPTSPVAERRMLMGREAELRLVERARRVPGKCVVIFGTQEVGKTSLAKALERNSSDSVYRPVSRRDSFESVCLAVLASFGASSDPKGLSIVDMARRLAAQKALVLLDGCEALRFEDRERMAELIGHLADHGSHATLVIIGTAEAVFDLVPDKQVAKKYVLPVELKPLSPAALEKILVAGFREIPELRLDSLAKEYVLQRAFRSPAEVHRYAVNSTYALLERFDLGEKEDLLITIDECRLGESFEPTVG